uniref:Uncharacterized protein n=1 Tax=Sphaerodactylus townsendi TaxID=933632 RepID=A0ACB8G7X4_9SAUR
MQWGSRGCSDKGNGPGWPHSGRGRPRLLAGSAANQECLMLPFPCSIRPSSDSWPFRRLIQPEPQWKRRTIDNVNAEQMCKYGLKSPRLLRCKTITSSGGLFEGNEARTGR